MRKQQGISLVELMVSITVGLILMTGVVQLFLSSRATFSTQQAISRVQETGRLAMEFMSEHIRMAGYMGCMSRNMNYTSTLNTTADDLTYKFDVGIEGFDFANDSGPTTLPAGFPNVTVKPGTDILIARSANENAVGVTQNNNGSQLFAQFTDVVPDGCGAGENQYSGICEGDVLIVADCKKARVFQATNLTPGGTDQTTGLPAHVNVPHSNSGPYVPGNAQSSWYGQSVDPNSIFGTDSEIIKVNSYFYYIAEGTSGRPSLWRKVGSQDALELLEGVENMQLTYGRDTDSDSIPDSYVTAKELDDANDWESALSVRVQLLVSSADDNVLQEAQAYTFNGNTVTPSDRRLRQVFTNTVGIRSRLP